MPLHLSWTITIQQFLMIVKWSKFRMRKGYEAGAVQVFVAVLGTIDLRINKVYILFDQCFLWNVPMRMHPILFIFDIRHFCSFL